MRRKKISKETKNKKRQKSIKRQQTNKKTKIKIEKQEKYGSNRRVQKDGSKKTG